MKFKSAKNYMNQTNGGIMSRFFHRNKRPSFVDDFSDVKPRQPEDSDTDFDADFDAEFKRIRYEASCRAATQNDLKDMTEQEKLEYLSKEDYEFRMRSLGYFSDRDHHELADVNFGEFYEYAKSRVMGHDAALKVACYYVWNYFRALSEKAPVRRNNFIIAGISGSGKTEFMRMVSDFLKTYCPRTRLPVCRIDTSNVTETGYKGGDFYDLLSEGLLNNSSGVGIVFLDEFDKKLVKSISGQGRDTNEPVQNNMLVAIEGLDVSCEKKSGTVTINTRNTLFVAMGTFDDVRKGRSDSALAGILKDVKGCNYWDDITEDDVLKQGAKEELLGRFSDIVNFGALTDDAMRAILKKHIRDNYELNPSMFVRNILIDRSAEDELLQIARGNKRGVRYMVHKFDMILRDKIIDLVTSDMENYNVRMEVHHVDDIEVIFDKDTIEVEDEDATTVNTVLMSSVPSMAV